MLYFYRWRRYFTDKLNDRELEFLKPRLTRDTTHHDDVVVV